MAIRENVQMISVIYYLWVQPISYNLKHCIQIQKEKDKTL